MKFQIHAPLSKQIIGDKIGVEPPGSKCWGCNRTGHFKGECPVEWGKAFKPLPGWDLKGERKLAEWNGEEPKKATFVAWVKFLQSKDNFPAGCAVAANVQDAPELGHYQERAKNARP